MQTPPTTPDSKDIDISKKYDKSESISKNSKTTENQIKQKPDETSQVNKLEQNNQANMRTDQELEGSFTHYLPELPQVNETNTEHNDQQEKYQSNYQDTEFNEEVGKVSLPFEPPAPSFIEDCQYSANQNWTDPRCFIKIKINSHITDALIDTGATQTFIDTHTRNVLQRTRTKVRYQSGEIQLADGSTVPIREHYNVRLQIHGQIVQGEVTYLNALTHPVLLGMDVLRRLNFSLKINNQEISSYIDVNKKENKQNGLIIQCPKLSSINQLKKPSYLARPSTSRPINRASDNRGAGRTSKIVITPLPTLKTTANHRKVTSRQRSRPEPKQELPHRTQQHLPQLQRQPAKPPSQQIPQQCPLYLQRQAATEPLEQLPQQRLPYLQQQPASQPQQPPSLEMISIKNSKQGCTGNTVHKDLLSSIQITTHRFYNPQYRRQKLIFKRRWDTIVLNIIRPGKAILRCAGKTEIIYYNPKPPEW